MTNLPNMMSNSILDTVTAPRGTLITYSYIKSFGDIEKFPSIIHVLGGDKRFNPSFVAKIINLDVDSMPLSNRKKFQIGEGIYTILLRVSVHLSCLEHFGNFCVYAF
jgi:hypothetical protein